MKHRKSHIISIWFCLLFVQQTRTHGFDPDTLVKNGAGSWHPLAQVCEFTAKNKKQNLASYDVNKKCWVNSRVVSGGKSETNCYLSIGLNGKHNDVICTPTQEFYLVTGGWIQAYQLRIGDVLLGQYNTLVVVSHIEFVKKKRAVCSIEVKNTHTFMVGQHAVLTHNMVLPVALLASAKIPFELSAIGSALGLSFGAPAIVGGLVVGGIAGIVWKKIIGGKVIDYKLSFNMHAIEKHRKKNDTVHLKKSKNKKESDKKKKTRNKAREEHLPLNNKDARKKAKELGYVEDKEPPMRTKKVTFVNKKRNYWITPDIDGHNGGHWKGYDRAGNRTTWDIDLKNVVGK
jgi:hypothetical protein